MRHATQKNRGIALGSVLMKETFDMCYFTLLDYPVRQFHGKQQKYLTEFIFPLENYTKKS